MTVKDIFNTPISEMWSIISPFAIGYLIFSIVIFILVSSFIVYIFIKVMKEHKEFGKRFKRRWQNQENSEGAEILNNQVYIVTDKKGKVVYASLNKGKALDFTFENKFIITTCELDE